jgi:hypothetical protein
MVEPDRLVRDLRQEMRALEEDLFPVSGRESAEAVTQSAAAWILATVFVRFCEDNELVDAPFLAGPGDRLSLARERQLAYFRRHPERTARDWIVAALDALSTSVTTLQLFDNLYDIMARLPISPSAASALLSFWRRTDQDGLQIHDFTDQCLNTGFLADLYVGLSEAARKDYALIQTPGFVADLILDHTLTPAVETFGLLGLRTIDPVCGSGTFVLGTFHRLLDAWRQDDASALGWDAVQRALSSVHGSDKNPAAVAICRFRLLMAAITAAGAKRLSEVPELPIVIGMGDSLMHGTRTLRSSAVEYDSTFLCDTYPATNLLATGSYDVVVGNPPYLTVRNPGEQEAYRSLYPVCRGKYALTVPFIVRFFELARSNSERTGFVGTLVSDSFMKREFGRLLVEDFLPTVDLTHVIDTSGAYIPGHGTPTVILIGRARQPQTQFIRAIVGIRGEPASPPAGDPGIVWKAITEQIGGPESESEWVVCADYSRERFAKHPWSLTGSGASNLLQALERGNRLDTLRERIGYYATTGSDDAFIAPLRVFQRHRAETGPMTLIVTGSELRDWLTTADIYAFFPGTSADGLVDIARFPYHFRRLWPYRTVLRERHYFGTQPSVRSREDRWYRWHQVTNLLGAHAWSITFPWVATHAHFVILRGDTTPLQSAPVIRLPASASEDDFYGLEAILNSSTPCFWLKQYSHSKGAPRGDQLRPDEPWEHIYEFTSTNLEKLPLPSGFPADRGRELDELAQQLIAVQPSAVCDQAVPTRNLLNDARAEQERIRCRMIALQEELDWDVYRRYGLIGGEDAAGLVAAPDRVPPVQLGERAFEIAMARRMNAGELETQWFTRHNSRPISEIPEGWPEDYRAVVGRRIDAIEQNRDIGLIERPEYKRRWYWEPWQQMEHRALRDWLLDRCEERSLWYQTDGSPRPMTVGRLADRIRADGDTVSVAHLLYGDDIDLYDVLEEIIADEHVPFLAQYRYRDGGLAKYAAWEKTWNLQREEDKSGVLLDVPVPPKYASADFRKMSYWHNRGKLDVPKERFISYPGANPDDDDSLLLGWGGWDFREQANALVTLIEERSVTDGWDTARLVPLLAGLAEIMPWVRQWYNDIDPAFGQSPADAYDAYLTGQCERYGLPLVAIRNWAAPPVRRGRPPKKRVPTVRTSETRRR